MLGGSWWRQRWRRGQLFFDVFWWTVFAIGVGYLAFHPETIPPFKKASEGGYWIFPPGRDPITLFQKAFTEEGKPGPTKNHKPKKKPTPKATKKRKLTKKPSKKPTASHTPSRTKTP